LICRLFFKGSRCRACQVAVQDLLNAPLYGLGDLDCGHVFVIVVIERFQIVHKRFDGLERPLLKGTIGTFDHTALLKAPGLNSVVELPL